MLRFVNSLDPLEYVSKQKRGIVYNFIEPDTSYRLEDSSLVRLESLDDVVPYLEKGIPVYIPFANAFVESEREKISAELLSFVIKHYRKLRKGDLVLVSNVKVIPKEIEQYVVYEEEEPPSAEEIRKTIEEVFEEKKGRKPEPSEGRVIEEVSKRLTGLTLSEVRNAAILSLERYGNINEDFMIKEKLRNIKKRTDLEYDEPQISLDDIGGLEKIKTYVKILKETMNEKAQEFGIKPPKGLLILGPQGTAKSTIPKAIANYLGIPYVKFRIGAFMSKYYGETERQIHRVLKTIDSIGRCLVHIDEMDKVLRKASESHEATARIGGILMEWMAEKSGMTPVVMTGNYAEYIDTDFKRAGRIDTIFWTWFPKRSERKEIWEIHLRKVGRDPKAFDLDLLAEESRFYTGSEIETAIQIALRIAFVKGKDITTKLLLDTLKKAIVPVYEKEREKFRRMYASLQAFVPASDMKDSDTIPEV